MRTYIRTEVTLDTVVRIPYRNLNSDAALLICGGTGWCGTICVFCKCGYGQGVTFLSAYLCLNVVDEVNYILSSLGYNCIVKTFVFTVLPALRNLYLVHALSACVDSCPVLLNNVLALAAVGCLCSSLHQLICLLSRNDAGQLEERGLKDGVDTCWAHACLNTNLYTVDGVEVDVVVSDELLNLSWKMLLKTFHIPWAV